jgi:hypothetical protein
MIRSALLLPEQLLSRAEQLLLTQSCSVLLLLHNLFENHS